MDVAPLRIECIDVSHVQGTDVVASLVVFEDGLPKRSDYRRFAIREHPGDDVASIAEVVRRRFTHGARQRRRADVEACRRPARTARSARDGRRVTGQRTPSRTYRRGIDPETGRPRRFAYPPQLLVVDGGAPQVNAAATELAELGIVDVTICGLAKRLEEVWVPGQDEPIIFPRTSEALYLLQRLRDEAHRFAITYHRAKRSKSMTVSALDNVAGLGEVRRKALVRHFGSVAALRRADVEEVLAVPGLGRRTAEAVVAALGRHGRGAAVAGTGPGTAAATAVGRVTVTHGDRGRPDTVDGHAGKRRSGERDRRWVTGRGLRWARATDGRAGDGAADVAPPADAGHEGRNPGRDRLRAVRRRPVDRRQVPGGPRLVRGRQPAAGADHHDGRPGFADQRRRHPDRDRAGRPVHGRSPRIWPR